MRCKCCDKLETVKQQWGDDYCFECRSAIKRIIREDDWIHDITKGNEDTSPRYRRQLARCQKKKEVSLGKGTTDRDTP